MREPLTIDDVLVRIKDAHERVDMPPLPPPEYKPSGNPRRVLLAVETFKRHTSDEGWQLQIGLEAAGYAMYGRYLPNDEVDVPTILARENPGVVVVQDKREWDSASGCCFDKTVAFQRVEALAERPEIFRATVLKDAHADANYHAQAAQEIGAHAWIGYYHPRIVTHLAPYVRREHYVRTYHSIDALAVPARRVRRRGCLLSGATFRRYYPLRSRFNGARARGELPYVDRLSHPGYAAKGCAVAKYMRVLNQYKVAICTASVFGYALRKIIEATACGCAVLTDLPRDEVLPEIDGNLVRIHPEEEMDVIADVLNEMQLNYCEDRQREYAERAKRFYDYRRLCTVLAADLERARNEYA